MQIRTHCPFDTWGIDIIGPFPATTYQRQFILLIIDHQSKYVVSKAMGKITSAKVIDFIWKNVICRFGVPRVLVSDNGPQFASKEFHEWCGAYKIQQNFTSVGHP